MKHIPVINISCKETISQSQFEAALSKVLNKENYILGEEVKRVEKDIANYLNVEHAIGVANGTDALVLALDALGIGPEDEVITTPFTFFASAETICRVGAKPVFADVKADTYNIDPEAVRAVITPKTKAIMNVHIFGNPVDVDSIAQIAKEYGLYVIEDACQAIGASYDGTMIGGAGHIGCFSFFPTKNLGGFGDGGLITTDDTELAEKIRMLRFHGQKVKYQNEIIGYNSRLDELQAAILNVKLPYLEKWNNRRREIAARYNAAFKEIKEIQTPKETLKGKSVYHIYSLMVENRNDLTAYLDDLEISTAVYYAIPLHLQKALLYLGYQKGDFPVTERLAERALALPMYPSLSNEDQDRVIEAIIAFYKKL